MQLFEVDTLVDTSKPHNYIHNHIVNVIYIITGFTYEVSILMRIMYHMKLFQSRNMDILRKLNSLLTLYVLL